MIWAGARGQPARLPGGAVGCRIAYAWGLLFVFASMSMVPLMAFRETRLWTILAVVVLAVIVVLVRKRGKRPAIFVTDRRVLERTLFGTTAVDLGMISGYFREVVKYRDRFGNIEEVATNIVVLVAHHGGRRGIGPVAEYDELTSLLDGLISREIDPTKMRGLDPISPAAAETREDLFVAVRNRTEGDEYGPLIIGPRGLVRFTEKLPIGLEGLLLTRLAEPNEAEDLEAHAVFLSRRPDAGHVLLVDLSKAELGMDGTALRVKTSERTLHIQLDDADVMRARRYLQAREAARQAAAIAESAPG